MNQNELLIMTFLLVFFSTVAIMLKLLPFLKKKKMGQHILATGPNWHKNKEGTPTMGGVAPAIAITIVCVLSLCIPHTFNSGAMSGIVLTLLFALASGGIGIVDDLTKFRHKENQGLTPLQKLVLQTVFSMAYLAMLYLYGWIDTSIKIPFSSIYVELGFWFYPLALCFIVGTVNFANLTDGLDGLASSVSLIVGGCFAFYASHLYAAEITVLSAALMGGALGFLLFNYHPAKIFMGDTGSLFLGGLAVGISFLCRSPLLIVFCGIIFYLEGLSVVLQVLYFKLTNGKRLFKMAPLHHHFEKNGWSEEKVVFVFTLLSLLGAVIGVFAYA